MSGCSRKEQRSIVSDINLIHSTTIVPSISMSQKELDKYEVIQGSLRKEITVKRAGEPFYLSERYLKPDISISLKT